MPEEDWSSVCVEGGRISAGEAAKLELELFSAPDNIHSRVLLLGYYFLDQTPQGRSRRNNHIFWLIEHRPELKLEAYSYILVRESPDAYSHAKLMWERVIENRGTEPVILKRASEFFTINDRRYAEELLRRGAALEPSSRSWRERLAFVYMLNQRKAETPEQRADAARKALGAYEAVLAFEMPADHRFKLMNDAAEAAFWANDHSRATEYAEQVLSSASDFKDSWTYGNGIHYAHIVLGRVALANNDIPAACGHLAAAGDTPGSPQLNSFGPNQDLAVELLARGEYDAVVAYANACRRFFSGPLAVLDAALNRL